MKKSLLILMVFCLMIFTSACNGIKPSILFNTAPISTQNALNSSNTFECGRKIYYLVIIPKPIKSRYAYIQIVKKGDEHERLGHQLFYGNTVRLKDEQMYYYDDYIVIYEKGAYVMQVYSKDNPTKVLTSAPFWVK